MRKKIFCIPLFFTVVLLSLNNATAQQAEPSLEQAGWQDSSFVFAPNYYASFAGGQYFFAGDEAALSGNFYAAMSPAMKFSDQWSLVPVYTLNYKGTKQVTDLVGGGTLFQQSQDHAAVVKLVYRPNNRWSFKPSLGFKHEFLKETKDEKWGQGLFDYSKPSVGFEAEYIYKKPFAVRAAYDFYALNFVNYASLESRLGSDLSRELVGADVLDSVNHALSFGGSAGFSAWGHPFGLEASYGLTSRAFPEQKIVLNTGLYDAQERADLAHSASVSALTPIAKKEKFKLSGSVDLGFMFNNSNQNNYDASRAVFNENFYDYAAFSLTPAIRLLMGGSKKETQIVLASTLSRQDYASRRVQEAGGAYLSDAINLRTSIITFSIKRPIEEGFHLTMMGAWGESRSNMEHEKVYRYNYKTANYLFGFSYEY